MDICKLRELILSPCENIIRIPYKTEDYKDVLKLWKHFKKGWLSSNKFSLLEQIFTFRDMSRNHALIYSSSLILDSVLLLGKIDGKYINLLLPRHTLDIKDFVAVYI